MVVRKSKRGDFEIEELDDIELPTDLDDKISKITLDAEADIDSTRVNFRWQKAPLNLIKSVAKEMGIPYQTYIKQVLYRQALSDLDRIRAIDSNQYPTSNSQVSVHKVQETPAQIKQKKQAKQKRNS